MTRQRWTLFVLIPIIAIAVLTTACLSGADLTTILGLLTFLFVVGVLWAWRRALHRQLGQIDNLALSPEELSAFKPLLFVFFGFYIVMIAAAISIWYFQWSQLFLPLCAVWLIRKELWCLLCESRLKKPREPMRPGQSRTGHWLLRWLTGCITFYAVLCALMFVVQRSLIFIPSHEDPVTELKPWIHAGETIGYSREVTEPENIWLMMHGNAGQAANRDYVLPRMSADDSLYVLEYPGYGSRPGQPGRESFNAAAAEAYQLLRKQFPSTPINVMGESIGTGPASSLANQSQPPDKLVLIVPFDALAEVAAEKFFWLPVRTLLFDNWNNIESLKNYKNPVTIYGAKQDEIISIAHARELAKHVSHAQLIEIEGGHNEWSFSEAVKIRGK